MYFNRELSWLKFNERVLLEANDMTLPILERIKFNAIFSSNLDEFFMVRVASIKDQMNIGYNRTDPSGMAPEPLFISINQKVSELVELQNKISETLMQGLKDNHFNLLRREDYTKGIRGNLKQLFNTSIFPVLTPMAVDFSRPFPLISNKSLYIAVKLLVNQIERLALVEVPSVLTRLISFDCPEGDHCYVLLEDIIEEFIADLFIGNTILATCQFRITRNGDLNVIQEDTDILLNVIEEAIKLRKWGEAIRLEISYRPDEWLKRTLVSAFHMEDSQVYEIKGLMDKTVWFKFKPPKALQHLQKEAYIPRKLPFMAKKNIFKTIREGDVFLHHPYESFDFVVDFIKQASKDPQVLAIKQTLYRVSGDSEIVKALAEAAEKGKQVTVLLELMARFDEQNNINWAKKLEQKGVHVIYGLYGLKTHSKITLVVRKEKQRIRRYVHLGTGNYNDQTAKLYTDMGLFTCKESFGADASIFFNLVSGFSNDIFTHAITVAPYHLRKQFYTLIDRETDFAKKGRPAKIIAKMNALVDKEIVDRLYEASKAGVKIKLIVRGMCVIVPGVEGLSENIEVVSIVGEFLEHSRIFYFHNDHHPEVYLSSADWMTRNLDRRVELLFPVEDKIIAKRIEKTLELYLKDNQKSWTLLSDGNYEKKSSKTKSALKAQDLLKSLQYNDNEEFIKKV